MEHIRDGSDDARPVGPDGGDGDMHGASLGRAVYRGSMRRALILIAALTACTGTIIDTVPTPVTFHTARGPYSVQAEVADDPDEQARGLMGRSELAADTGMLFVWDDVAPRSFFMEDTLIPLDLISIRAGRVVAVQGMVPCEADPCPITETPAADAALEVEAGTAARAGIEPGILVESPALA